MAPKQMTLDVSEFCEILLNTLKHDVINQAENKLYDGAAENFIFKDLFALNYVKVGKVTPTRVHGLSDIINSESIGEKLIIASGNAAKKASNSFLEDDDDDAEHTKVSYTDVNLSQQDQKKIFSNEAYFIEETIVRSGSASSSLVYYLNSKTHLQSVEGMNSEKIINVDDLAPLKLKDARYLVTIYIQAVNRLRKHQGKNYESISIPWLLIKCDKIPPQLVSWLYCTIEVDKNETEQQQKGCFRSFIIKEQDVLIDHEKECRRLLQDEKGHASYMSRYDLLGSLLSKADNEKKASSLFIEFAWKEESGPLDLPPSSADAVAKFKIYPSDPCSPLAPIYMELTKLDRIIKGVKQPNQLWSNIPNVSSEDASLVDGIASFLEELMSVKFEEKISVKKDEQTNDLSAPLLSYILDGFKRSDMDFTDKLWNFLKNAKSLDEVVSCLDNIFAAICTREVQPVFSSENKTFLARMIREFYKSADMTTSSEDLHERLNEILENDGKVFDILADIGLEKFKKDYVSFFVNEDLATFGQLEPILAASDNGLRESMSAIWKMHHSLELVSIGRTYLHLEVDYLRTLLRSSLNYFIANDVTPFPPTFALSIPFVSASATTLKNLCYEIKPDTWKLATVSSKEGAENLSMFILSQDGDKQLDDHSRSLQEDDPVVTYKALSVTENKVRIF
eukprot:gene7309-8126_t